MKDWATRIKEAEARGKFSQSDLNNASSWMSCATSENPNLHGLDNYTATVNGHLKAYDMGMKFYFAVMNDEIKEAKELHRAILKLRTPRNLRTYLQ
jgi:hypothetical protein